jgi:glycosyltransferase involved in cell wall biosynthesis
MEMISIIIPMYNEEEAIGGDLDTIIQTMSSSDIPWEIIVVDDGSTDASAEIVRQREGVRLIQHPYNRGTGAARTTGLQHARGDVIVMTDGDGTYPNQDIPHLLTYIGEYDMVVGARKREMGTLKWLRSLVKLSIRLLASYLAGVRIPDLNSGLRAFKKDIAEGFLPILPPTHSWVGTITVAFLSEGYTVKFIPIDYYKRKGGKSSIHPISDTYNYISLVVRTIMYFNPLKIFLPLSLFLFLVGGGKMVYDIFAYHFHFAPSTVITILTAVQVGAIGLLADLIVRRGRR